jgi:hypothetical protein
VASHACLVACTALCVWCLRVVSELACALSRKN